MSKEAVQEHPGVSDGVALEPTSVRDGGLLAIGIFKLVKSAFFFCMGVGAFHLLHKDLGDEAMRLAQALRFDPEGRVVTLLMEKVDLIDMRHLREIGFGVFAYSGLALVEGFGLLFEKPWAEYLTLCLTVAFLPWELWELAHGPTPFRIGILLTNLAVLAYLVWLLNRKKSGFCARCLGNCSCEGEELPGCGGWQDGDLPDGFGISWMVWVTG